MNAPRSHDSFVIYRAVLLGAMLFVLGSLFTELLTVMVAGMATIILAMIYHSIAKRLMRLKIPFNLALFLSFLIVGVCVTAVGYLIGPPLFEQGRNFIENLPAISRSIQDQLQQLTGWDSQSISDGTDNFVQKYEQNPESLIGPVASIGLGIIGVIGGLLFMVTMAYYMAHKPEPLVRGFLRLFHPNRRDHVEAAMKRIRTMWVGWLEGVLIHMLVSFVLTYVGLTILGIDYALVFAAITAVLVIVPIFGTIVAGAIAILYALTISPEKALLVSVVFILTQQVEGNIIIPLVMSNRVKLHPVVIGIGVIMVEHLLGFIGLFVSVPIICLLMVLVEEFWVKPLEGRAPPLLGPTASADADYHEKLERSEKQVDLEKPEQSLDEESGKPESQDKPGLH